jgi:hypothetical protein
MSTFRTGSLVLSAALTFGCTPSDPAPHPLVGKWTWALEGNGCTETYDWRSDGSSYVQSGTEVREGRYTIAGPEGGFYAVTEEVITDNGGVDCASSTENLTGQKVTLYVFLAPLPNVGPICRMPSFDTCFGMLRRLPN